jgi:hypothetical protein
MAKIVKNWHKIDTNLAFFTQNTASLWKKIYNIGLKEKRQFCGEKLAKIAKKVIITLTPA